MKAVCSGCGFSGVPSPARVVSLVPAAADIGTEQDRVGAPSRWTVQAPHCASPQPKCGLLSPSSLRSTYKSGVSGATSTVCSCPLSSKAMRSAICQPSLDIDSILGSAEADVEPAERGDCGRITREQQYRGHRGF